MITFKLSVEELMGVSGYAAEQWLQLFNSLIWHLNEPN